MIEIIHLKRSWSSNQINNRKFIGDGFLASTAWHARDIPTEHITDDLACTSAYVFICIAHCKRSIYIVYSRWDKRTANPNFQGPSIRLFEFFCNNRTRATS